MLAWEFPETAQFAVRIFLNLFILTWFSNRFDSGLDWFTYFRWPLHIFTCCDVVRLSRPNSQIGFIELPGWKIQTLAEKASALRAFGANLFYVQRHPWQPLTLQGVCNSNSLIAPGSLCFLLLAVKVHDSSSLRRADLARCFDTAKVQRLFSRTDDSTENLSQMTAGDSIHFITFPLFQCRLWPMLCEYGDCLSANIGSWEDFNWSGFHVSLFLRFTNFHMHLKSSQWWIGTMGRANITIRRGGRKSNLAAKIASSVFPCLFSCRLHKCTRILLGPPLIQFHCNKISSGAVV